MTEDILELTYNSEQVKNKDENMKSENKSKRRGSMTSAETSIYTTEVLSRQYRETFQISEKKTCSMGCFKS